LVFCLLMFFMTLREEFGVYEINGIKYNLFSKQESLNSKIPSSTFSLNSSYRVIGVIISKNQAVKSVITVTIKP
jgi:hypothetical protein